MKFFSGEGSESNLDCNQFYRKVRFICKNRLLRKPSVWVPKISWVKKELSLRRWEQYKINKTTNFIASLTLLW